MYRCVRKCVCVCVCVCAPTLALLVPQRKAIAFWLLLGIWTSLHEAYMESAKSREITALMAVTLFWGPVKQQWVNLQVKGHGFCC